MARRLVIVSNRVRLARFEGGERWVRRGCVGHCIEPCEVGSIRGWRAIGATWLRSYSRFFLVLLIRVRGGGRRGRRWTPGSTRRRGGGPPAAPASPSGRRESTMT